MIRATSFAIHLTYTCPLACKHCCFSSSPAVKDRLTSDQVFALIRSLAGREMELLAFTGGEPFLFGARLVDFVREGKRYARAVRIVTSAHWATSDIATERRLRPLVDAGLDQLSISWDDYHEEFVSFANVRRAFVQGKAMGVQTAISIVQSPQSRWTAERVREGLQGFAAADDVVVEAPLNYTGRAQEELAGSGVKASKHLGPCPYVMTGPTASAKGKLLACCGVIPETEDLVLSDELTPSSVWRAIEAGGHSALLHWLHLRGPYAIMEWISQRHGIAIPSQDQIGGNCEACKLLFGMPEVRTRLADAVQEMSGPISDEATLLDSLGLMNSQSLMALWSDGAISEKETEDA
jgi:pyruvate-formate lyase-activating enzyme